MICWPITCSVTNALMDCSIRGTGIWLLKFFAQFLYEALPFFLYEALPFFLGYNYLFHTMCLPALLTSAHPSDHSRHTHRELFSFRFASPISFYEFRWPELISFIKFPVSNMIERRQYIVAHCTPEESLRCPNIWTEGSERQEVNDWWTFIWVVSLQDPSQTW